MDAFHWWSQGDAVTQGTALLLLAMSVATWVIIVWKLRLMRRASADVARAHNTEGSTGLGLAIVTAVMEAHGGSASVDSVPGRTRFTLHVPLA